MIAYSLSLILFICLSDTGKVYVLYVNEAHLNTPRSYTVQLSLKKISSLMPTMSIRKLHTGFNSALYLTSMANNPSHSKQSLHYTSEHT